jgi:ubiquinone/menaquinone biosynthesis C-methylase UbiE
VFDETARSYDRIYAFKDYAAESTRLTELIRERIGNRGGRLLDVACGTGRHLELSAASFEVCGLDVHHDPDGLTGRGLYAAERVAP